MRVRVHIVLGIVCNDARDKVLVARRPRCAHLGGLWEFPGGKVQAGEPALVALKRELYEEVNVEVGDCTPLLSFDYDYPDRLIHFQAWTIHDWSGEVTGKEGQETRWADIRSLSAQDFPAANKGIIDACRLPPLYLITPDLDRYSQAVINKLQGYLAAGVKLVQFRSKTTERHELAVMRVMDVCRSHGAGLMVNASPEVAVELGASGVHLTSERLRQCSKRPLPAGYRVAASCHSLEELHHAVAVGVDFCVLSPVRKPSGKDGIALGWDRFADMVGKIPIPVYALGGMELADLERARQHGAQGIALISAVWNRADSTAQLREYPG